MVLNNSYSKALETYDLHVNSNRGIRFTVYNEAGIEVENTTTNNGPVNLDIGVYYIEFNTSDKVISNTEDVSINDNVTSDIHLYKDKSIDVFVESSYEIKGNVKIDTNNNDILDETDESLLADVSLYKDDKLIETVLTNSRGKYSFNIKDAGLYNIAVDTNLIESVNYSNNRSINITEGAKIVDFLFKSDKQEVFIKGKIINEKINPFDIVFESSQTSEVFKVPVNENGEFNRSIKAGRYYVKASNGYYSEDSDSLLSKENITSSTLINKDINENIYLVKDNINVTGNITNGNSNYIVYLISKNNFYKISVKDNGDFEISDIIPDEYSIVVKANNNMQKTISSSLLINTSLNIPNIDVSSIQISGIYSAIKDSNTNLVTKNIDKNIYLYDFYNEKIICISDVVREYHLPYDNRERHIINPNINKLDLLTTYNAQIAKEDNSITTTGDINLDVNLNDSYIPTIENMWYKEYVNLLNNTLNLPFNNDYDNKITRIEVASIICNIIGMQINHNDHQDIINKIQSIGIMNGYPDGTFKSENNITREEISKVIIKALEYIVKNDIKTENLNTKFSDDNEIIWSKPYVTKLYNMKAINGYVDNTFKPKNNATRAEFLKILYESLVYIQIY